MDSCKESNEKYITYQSSHEIPLIWENILIINLPSLALNKVRPNYLKNE
jgi:hypothetical protein